MKESITNIIKSLILLIIAICAAIIYILKSGTLDSKKSEKSTSQSVVGINSRNIDVDLGQVFRHIFLRIFIIYPASLEEMI